MILYPSKIFYSTKNSNYSIVFRHNKILFIIALKRLWTTKCKFLSCLFFKLCSVTINKEMERSVNSQILAVLQQLLSN